MKRTLAIILALVLVLSLTACGGTAPSTEASTSETSTTETPTTEDPTTEAETVISADTKEDVKKLVDEFCQGMTEADPISMTTIIGGETASVFTKDGDKYHVVSDATETDYYLFMQDGKAYAIYDGETASEDDFMYELTEKTVEMAIDMYIKGALESDIDGEDMTYTATRTDKTENGISISELVYKVTGTVEGKTAELTVTGKADADGRVSQILYNAVSGEEIMEMQLDMTYENISVDLPAYTIVEGGESGGAIPEFSHTDSPYATFRDLIDTLGEEEELSTMLFNDRMFVYCEKDGSYYQLSTALSEEDLTALEVLDYDAEDYNEQLYGILGKYDVEDCIDYTGALLSQEEMDTYVGQTARDMVDAGFEATGFSAYDDYVAIYLDKDGYVCYEVELEPSEDFDADSEFETDDLLDFPVKSIIFSTLEFYILPLE